MARKLRKLVKVGLFVLLLVVPFLAPILLYYSVDEPPPADDDLRVERASVPREENGFYLVQFKPEEIWLGSEEEDAEGNTEAELVWEMVEGQTWNQALAERVLEKNREALEKLDRALEARYFETPEIATFEDVMPHWSGWRNLHLVVFLRSRLELETGRGEQAIAEAMKLVLFGQRMQASAGVVIEALLGWATQVRGLKQVQKCVGRSTVAQDVLLKSLWRLSGCYASRKNIQDCLKSEYAVSRRTFDVLGRDNVLWDQYRASRVLPRWLAFKPNATKRLFADGLRAILEELAKPPEERQPVDFVALSGGPVGWFPRRNSAGRRWVLMFMPSLERAALRYLPADVQVSFTRAFIALKCHKLSKGELPASLDALVPEYFDQVPVDPYDGKPVRYSREKKILWSVGEDRVDSGGSASDGQDLEVSIDDEAEPTCRIDF